MTEPVAPTRRERIATTIPAFALFAVLFAVLSLGNLFAFPPADGELATAFSAYESGSPAVIDHGDWAMVLDRYLESDHPSGIARFDYGRVSSSDRDLLEDYIASLEAVDPSRLDRDEQMAYWINLYNAVTVRLILDRYPVTSIRKISKPWKTPLVTVSGRELTLNDVEHGILRPLWRDPRIHYAVNCASIGCPNLAGRPYTGETVERMLDEAARGYISHPRGASFSGSTLELSSIFKWYSEDFGSKREMLDHIAAYAPTGEASAIRDHNGRIKYGYDWDLNAP